MPDLPLQLPTVPEGFCNNLTGSDWVQQLMNLIAQGVAKFQGSGFTVVLNQEAQPGPTDRDKLWRKPSTGLVYEFSGGAWVTPHLYAPNSSVRLWWDDTLANLQTFDGGAVGVVGDNSGPMWEEDTNYQGKFPLHTGTVQPSGTAVAQGTSGGVDEITIAVTNLPQHQHNIGIDGTGNAADGGKDTFRTASTNIDFQAGTVSNALGVTRMAGGQATPDPVSILNPYRAGFWVKRTARKNYVGS